MIKQTNGKAGGATGGSTDMSQRENFDNLCTEIFALMDKGQDERVNVDEFVDTFFE